MKPLAPPVLIFVRPQAAGNMGALARVMANFGASELRLVGQVPESDPNNSFSKMDWALARVGENVLQAAQRFENLKEALSGIHLALGTSGKEDSFEKGYSRPQLLPTQAFNEVRQTLATQPDFKWALIMGPEDDGLRSDEVALCQKLIHIPTQAAASSMNIAMAAGVLLYHWSQIDAESPAPTPSSQAGAFELFEKGASKYLESWSTLDEAEKLLDYLVDTLKLTQFFKYPDHEAIQARLRRWLQSQPIPRGEMLVAFEVLYHLRSWGLGKFENRDFLSKK